jgi:hypothetical protein
MDNASVSVDQALASLPPHLPSAKGITDSDVQTVLHHFTGSAGDPVNASSSSDSRGNTTSQASTRSGLVVERSSVGKRKRSQPLGLQDCTDVEIGSMVLYLKSPDSTDQAQPFLMAQVLDKNIPRKTDTVHWYGPKNENVEWRKAKWAEWKNVLTPELYEAMGAEDKQKYRRKVGQRCLPSVEVKTLSGAEIFWHSFTLNKDDSIPKRVADKVERQLFMEEVVVSQAGTSE